MKKVEYELKILDINKEEIINKLKSLGATYKGKVKFERYVYDFNPINNNKWIRLRTNGIKTFITIKEIKNETIEGTSEIETEVGDFKTMNLLLSELGYKAKSYQENYRESYFYKDVQIEIDSWPKIPTYIEIEGNSRKEVLSIVNDLGFNEVDTTCKNTAKIYAIYGINLKKIKNLKF